MEDCEKYKKKFSLGMVIWLLTFIFEISKVIYFNFIIEIILVLVLAVYGARLTMPYLRCLSKFTRSIK